MQSTVAFDFYKFYTEIKYVGLWIIVVKISFNYDVFQWNLRWNTYLLYLILDLLYPIKFKSSF